MTAPSKTPERPGTVTAAQVFVALQAAALFCCGTVPALAWWPSFMAAIAYYLPGFSEVDSRVSVAMVVVPIGAAAYATVVIRRLGDGDRRGRSWVGAGLAALIVLAVAGALLLFAIEGDGHLLALISALPSILLQLLAWMCTHSEPTERWFRECESYLSEPNQLSESENIGDDHAG
ncbi:hypothetical protein [Glycomyces sp. YM15]|uniref:hypothetical protein n=1 Tax=Glycomyces sp. YM15 TaxID=2800446 RepID=UPI0019633FA1|nr:hypothetical protein [Glycomyces sp. YM15]